MAYASISVNPTSLTFENGDSDQYVTVSCADTTWVVGGGSSWCTITKLSNTRVKVSVTKNSGSKRTMAVVCVNGPNVASISVTQKGADNVTYDRSSKINVYQQITDYSCAATCAAMCVKKSPQTLRNDGFNLDDANWSGIAAKYGYTATMTDPASLSNVLPILKQGYPVIVKVNDSNPHWVVITKYTGDGTDVSENNFTCADPATGTIRALTSAARWNAVCKMVVIK